MLGKASGLQGYRKFRITELYSVILILVLHVKDHIFLDSGEASPHSRSVRENRVDF